MSSRYASSKPPQMYKCRYAYLRYYLSHIVATCEISESAVAYLCRKLYIGSQKKQVDLSVYCSARDMWACDHVPCDIYVQPILWQYHIWCDMHTRWAIYKRYVEHGYTDNMDGSMSNMLRYVQYVRYVR